MPQLHLEPPALIRLNEVMEVDDDDHVINANLDVQNPEMVDNNVLEMNIIYVK